MRGRRFKWGLLTSLALTAGCGDHVTTRALLDALVTAETKALVVAQQTDALSVVAIDVTAENKGALDLEVSEAADRPMFVTAFSYTQALDELGVLTTGRLAPISGDVQGGRIPRGGRVHGRRVDPGQASDSEPRADAWTELALEGVDAEILAFRSESFDEPCPTFEATVHELRDEDDRLTEGEVSALVPLGPDEGLVFSVRRPPTGRDNATLLAYRVTPAGVTLLPEATFSAFAPVVSGGGGDRLVYGAHQSSDGRLWLGVTNPEELYHGTLDTGFVRTSSRSDVGRSARMHWLASSPDRPDLIYAMSFDGRIERYDAGADRWTQLREGTPFTPDLRADQCYVGGSSNVHRDRYCGGLFTDDAGRIYGVARGGVDGFVVVDDRVEMLGLDDVPISSTIMGGAMTELGPAFLRADVTRTAAVQVVDAAGRGSLFEGTFPTQIPHVAVSYESGLAIAGQFGFLTLIPSSGRCETQGGVFDGNVARMMTLGDTLVLARGLYLPNPPKATVVVIATPKR